MSDHKHLWKFIHVSGDGHKREECTCGAWRLRS